MNVFEFRDSLIRGYEQFSTSFVIYSAVDTNDSRLFSLLFDFSTTILQKQ